MGRVNKATKAFGEPMVAARLSAVAVHPLLHNGPMTVIGHDKAVQVQVEPVLHRGTVDLGDEPARRGECSAVEADPRAAPVVVDDRLANYCAKPRHPIGQPFWDVATMQRQIGAAGFAS